MRRQAQWLFGTAAAYNIGAALSLLFLRPWLGPLLHLDPAAGANLVTLYLACGLVVVFGYSYALIARDPARYRDYIYLGIIGKAVAVPSLIAPWAAGQISGMLAATGLGDAIYLLLFLLFLRQHRVAD